MKTITKLGLAVILFMATAAGNYAQAQTKEETITWIKENLEKHGGIDGIVSYSFINVSVSPCSISFTEKDDDNDKPIYKYSFNPSEAKKWTVKEEVFVGLYISADKRIIKQNILSDDTNEYTWNISIKEGEPGIHERMIKALTHLATFCEQKKEAF